MIFYENLRTRKETLKLCYSATIYDPKWTPVLLIHGHIPRNKVACATRSMAIIRAIVRKSGV